EATLCRDKLAPDRVAAFAVEHLPGVQVAFGDGDGIAAPFSRLADRFAAQRRRQYRHAKFEADQVVGLVHRRVPTARVGLEAVFPEAVAGVFVRRLQYDIDAPAQVAEDRSTVALQRGHHLDHAVAFERAAAAQDLGQVVDAAGREAEPIARHIETGSVG